MPLALFDVDGTLIDQAKATARWAREFGEQRELGSDQIAYLAAALGERRSKADVFGDVVDTFALSDDPIRLWEAYRRRMPEFVTCPDGVLEALAAMRSAGWTIGIVTNGEVDNQEGKILRTGLGDAVDGWVISAEAGVRKPDPAIFALAARRLGAPLRGWMIGDGLESDVLGGAAAGMETAWIAGDVAGGLGDVATITAPDVPTAITRILASS